MVFPHTSGKPTNGCLWHLIIWLVNTAPVVEELLSTGAGVALLAKENWQGGPY